MKRKMFTLFSLLAVMLVVGFNSCQKDELVVEQTAEITLHVTAANPVFLAGHQAGNAENECAQIGTFNFAYKFDPPTSGTISHAGNEITIVNLDGTYFNWTATVGIDAVIVKGGNDANAWFYDPAAYADNGLYSPNNPNGQPAELSHITFCWNNVPECEWFGETAWGFGPRYVNKGNWAMYTPFQTTDLVDLIAGKEFVAGTIQFSAVVDGETTITITLNEGFRLEEFEGEVIEEAVKIQGYINTPVVKNPAPGLFNTYKGTELVITVPAYAIYGIHLNVEREVCPEIE